MLVAVASPQTVEWKEKPITFRFRKTELAFVFCFAALGKVIPDFGRNRAIKKSG